MATSRNTEQGLKMSIKKIQLNKLIMLMHADKPTVITKLRDDIRTDLRKANGSEQGGGHFHEPFWHDAKNHVNNTADLTSATKDRISKNELRKRLYPILATGFLDWWDNKRRWTNEASESQLLTIKGSLRFPEIDCEVKVSNLLSVAIGGSEKRVIYPYFAEAPALTNSSARLLLHAMKEALPDQQAEELRVLDIIRAKSFSIADVGMNGTEPLIFKAKYMALLAQWHELKAEYSPA